MKNSYFLASPAVAIKAVRQTVGWLAIRPSMRAAGRPSQAGGEKHQRMLPQSPLAELFVRLPAETVELATQCSG